MKQSLIYRTLGRLGERMLRELDERVARVPELRQLSHETAARRQAEAEVIRLQAELDGLRQQGD